MSTEENSPKRASPTGRERPGRETLPGKTPEREQPKPVKVTKRSPKSPQRLPDSREIPQKRREENLFRRYWLSLKRRNARSELIWIGNKQMICRQPDLGDYGLASYAPAQPDDAPWDATLLESRWAELRNCRLACWAETARWPGNLERQITVFTGYEGSTRAEQGPQGSRRQTETRTFSSPPDDRDRAIHVTGTEADLPGQRARAHVERVDGQLPDPAVEKRPFQRHHDETTAFRFPAPGDPGRKRRALYFTWGGRNHVIAWNSRTKRMLPLGFTNIFTLPTPHPVSIGLEKAGCDYGGQVLPLTYQSSRRLLLWDENLEGFVVDRVRAPEWEHDYALSHDLEDYLETSPIVAGAISWFAAGREIDSTEWDLYGLEHLHTTLCNFYLGFIQQESLPFFLPRAGWRQGWPRPSGYGHFRATAPPGRTAANTAHAMGSISRPVLTSISRNPAMQPTELPPALSYCLYP